MEPLVKLNRQITSDSRQVFALEQSISFVAGVHRLENSIDAVLNQYMEFSEINDIEIVWCLNGPAIRDYVEIERKLILSGLAYKLARSEEGLGNAVRACIDLPSKEVVVFTGADLPFVFSDLKQSTKLTGAQFILGEKRLRDFWPCSSLGRNLARAISNIIHFLLFKCNDPNGSQIMSNQVWRMLVSRTKEAKFSIGLELYCLAVSNNIKTARVRVSPSPWLSFENSTVNVLQTSLSQFIALIKLKVRIS